MVEVEEVRLPALVAGERIDADEHVHRIDYEGGLAVLVPDVDADRVAKAVDTDRRLLRQESLEDILLFFDEVGRAWLDPANRWRRFAQQLGPRVTGYHPDNVAADLNFVGGAMRYDHLHDLIDTDIGDPGLLDHWTRYKSTYHRAWPKGLATHIMVGNVPLAGFFTMVRSLVTKNITVAKTARRDAVVPQCLAQCMFDVDPTNPVVRALTALYWEAESEIEDLVLDASDVVTVWGRAGSIDSIKHRLRYGTDLVEFGPKRSFALFLEGVEDWDRAALWLGFDVVNYNQEACFSTQEAFVVGDPGPLAEALARWLEEYARNVGPVVVTPDQEAHVQRCRMEASADGWIVLAPAGTGWTVIVTDGPAPLPEHPLGRTVYIHPCRDVSHALDTVDADVQTVAVEPFDRVWEVADRLGGAGADRVVSLGRAGRSWPQGFIHDGFRPMSRMVRWVAVEPRDHLSSQYPDYWRDAQKEERNYREWATGQRTFAERSLGAGKKE